MLGQESNLVLQPDFDPKGKLANESISTPHFALTLNSNGNSITSRTAPVRYTTLYFVAARYANEHVFLQTDQEPGPRSIFFILFHCQG